MNRSSLAAVRHTPEDYPDNTCSRPGRFPIVCIGYSAGGLAPLETIFRQLSPTTGMAFVIVSHMSRTGPTFLPFLLGLWSEMPAELARNDLFVKPNHIYIIPPGQEITMGNGHLRVRPRSKLKGWSNVITVFLNSLAKSREHPGIAVILSGLDADGTAALRAFKCNGGITIAQEPASAKFKDMPQTAIQTGSIDFVLKPEAIACKIESLAKRYRTDKYADHSAGGA